MRYQVASPAKINLFLHITSQRADGYHNLQSIFQLLDFCDDMVFETTTNSSISISLLNNPNADNFRLLQNILLANVKDNIIYKAADALRQHVNKPNLGCKIQLNKKLPMGGGIGGGSSNAATTLIVLNKLWQLNLTKVQLLKLGLSLGADVPIFIEAQSAWVEGVGEIITPLSFQQQQQILPDHQYVCLLMPDTHVSTPQLFKNNQLNRNQPSYSYQEFIKQPHLFGNVFEQLVTQDYSEINTALNYLQAQTQFLDTCTISPRLTGTGACVFTIVSNKTDAEKIITNAPCKGVLTKPIWQSKLYNF